jgi:ABC-type uncharacterized transport system substrate-binding protein
MTTPCLSLRNSSDMYNATPYGELSKCRALWLLQIATLLVAFFLSLCVLNLVPAHANDLQPKKVAYFEKGSFWLFKQSYASLQQALKQRPAFQYSYPDSLHKSPGWDTDDARMDAEARALLAGDADIIIAAGTSAVKALLRVTKNEKPIIGIALADPVAAGLLSQEGHSPVPSFTAEVFPNRWRSMYRVFHEVVGFKRLGIMYPKGAEGRVYAAVDDAHAVAQEQHFEIIESIIPDENTASCRAGIEELHKKGADSFFISPLVCFDWSENDPSDLLKLIHGYNMPTFARDGSLFVQGGALMGFSTWDFSPSANRLADAIEKICQGASPNSIQMIIPPEPLIAINLQSAVELGLTFPFDVLLVADEIYEKTTVPHME